jgi:hypothetical protein
MENNTITIADFSSHLFWDVKQGTIDLYKNQQLIIERIIQRGSRKDWQLMEMTYTMEQIITQVKRIDWLSEKDLAYVHVYFGIPYNEMKCYIKKLSVPYC